MLERESKQAEVDGDNDEDEGSKVALIERRQQLKAAQSTAASHKEADANNRKKRMRNKHNDTDHNSLQPATEQLTSQPHDEQKDSAAETALATADTPQPTQPTPPPQQPKQTRQGQPQQFVPFVRGRVKRKAKRSRQKNIRKDNRPDHLKPNYLTVLPRPNRSAAPQSQQQSGLVGGSNSVGGVE